MLKKILIAAAVVIGGFLAFVATRPDEFTVKRTVEINAPADQIFPLVNDFHNWVAWSPYEKLDAGMTRTIDGAASGTGAHYAWSGNDKVGQGQMTITASNASQLIVIKLEFEKPFKATNTAEFTFSTHGSHTDVTWAMSGQNNFIGKAMCVFMDMDKMVGKDFEQGLANLKAVVEKPVS